MLQCLPGYLLSASIFIYCLHQCLLIVCINVYLLSASIFTYCLHQCCLHQYSYIVCVNIHLLPASKFIIFCINIFYFLRQYLFLVCINIYILPASRCAMIELRKYSSWREIHGLWREIHGLCSHREEESSETSLLLRASGERTAGCRSRRTCPFTHVFVRTCVRMWVAPEAPSARGGGDDALADLFGDAGAGARVPEALLRSALCPSICVCACLFLCFDA